MYILLENIKKISYGISENECINVTIEFTDYLKKFNIIDINTNLHTIIKDPYENQSKKLFIYTCSDDIKIINELHCNLQEEIFINKKIIILTSYEVYSIAFNLQYLLQELGYLVTIIFKITKEDCLNSSAYLYIIIHNSNRYLHSFLPVNYIFYQIEQSQQSFDKETINMLNNSIAVWDYSVANKVLYLNIPFNKFYYNPFPLIYSNHTDENIKYDIFFYGSWEQRRSNILQCLSQKYNICIKYCIFGNERDELIKQSKMVINLHYYKTSILEIARINEVLKFGKLVITEKAIEGDNYNQNYYKNVVSYFDIIKDDLSNIQQLYDLIDFYLVESNYNQKVNIIKDNLSSFYNRSKFHLHKNLLSLNMQDNTMMYDVNVDTIYCLHLIETPFRMDAFKLQEYKPNVEIYPAVKANPGFKGCGLSYQNLIFNAKRLGLETITICEDDCCFNTDFEEKYNTIKSFLKQYTSGWDIFVGCIADLPTDTIVSNVIEYNGLTFVEIDKMHSTVFNIYNKTCYDKIIKWNQYDSDANTNTIDQYIKRSNFKIITTFTFEFKCIDVHSTLWGRNCFQEYEKSFNISLSVLKEKINEYNSIKK
jgi:hypothetical protein